MNGCKGMFTEISTELKLTCNYEDNVTHGARSPGSYNYALYFGGSLSKLQRGRRCDFICGKGPLSVSVRHVYIGGTCAHVAELCKLG